MDRNKKILLIALAALVLLIALALIFYPMLKKSFGNGRTEVKVSDEPAKSFTVVSAKSGEKVSLSDCFGKKPAVVNFWASWCPPCKAELPDFEKAYKKYGDRIEFMMVNCTDGSRETEATVKAFVESEGYSFPVYYDSEGDASDAYAVYSIPVTLFIGRDGSLIDSRIGMLDSETIESMMEQLLK